MWKMLCKSRLTSSFIFFTLRVKKVMVWLSWPNACTSISPCHHMYCIKKCRTIEESKGVRKTGTWSEPLHWRWARGKQADTINPFVAGVVFACWCACVSVQMSNTEKKKKKRCDNNLAVVKRVYCMIRVKMNLEILYW